MRNASNKSSRENKNIYFVFNNFFPKIVPFMRKYRKIWRHIICWINKAILAHAHSVVPKKSHRHTDTHTHTHTHTRMVLYTYVACLVIQYTNMFRHSCDNL
jgi:hypothetical protein